jgi:hypothetical protein
MGAGASVGVPEYSSLRLGEEVGTNEVDGCVNKKKHLLARSTHGQLGVSFFPALYFLVQSHEPYVDDARVPLALLIHSWVWKMSIQIVHARDEA